MPRLRPEQVAAHVKASVGNSKIKKISDGNSLFLIARNGRGYWSYNWREGASFRTKLLGNAPEMSPAKARQAREELAVQRRAGMAPERRGLSVRRANPGPLQAAGKLFGEVVTEYLEGYWQTPRDGGEPEYIPGRAAEWRNGIEGQEASAYRRTLLRHPLAKRPVALIDTDDISNHLRQFKPATADKTRLRIQTVLDYAKARNYRDGENPARLKGHFEYIPRPKAAKVEHHPAMASADVPQFMTELVTLGTVEARALAFTIVTAARTAEITGARWKEIEGNVWTVPGSRMKEGIEHRVPLSPAALKILGKPGAPNEFIFPSRRYGAVKPLWHSSMLKLLKVVRPGFTVHGYRSTFSTWAANAGFSAELREMALAHSVGDATFKAYNRDQLVELRRKMMDRWSKFAIVA